MWMWGSGAAGKKPRAEKDRKRIIGTMPADG
jgi:hypothetical protein